MMNNEYTHVSAHQHAKHGTWMITTIMMMMMMITIIIMMMVMINYLCQPTQHAKHGKGKASDAACHRAIVPRVHHLKDGFC